MTDHIKVEGTEITEEHVGKKLIIVETESREYLPVGFEGEICRVEDDGQVFLFDTAKTEHNGSCYGVSVREYQSDDWKFKLGEGFKARPKTSITERKRLAKEIRAAKEVLKDAVLAAREVGMVVDGENITYNPPQEKY